MTVEGQAVIVAVRVVKTVEVVISCVLTAVGVMAGEETAGEEAAVVWPADVVWVAGSPWPPEVLAELPVVAPEGLVTTEI